MTNAAGRCEEIDSIEKGRIHCPTCAKDYAILKLTHLCSLVPCGRNGRVKYEERYYTVNLETPAETQLMCNNCETDHKKATAPRKGMCPECKYAGWYVQDDTGICPACIAKKQQPVEPDPPVAPITFISAMELPPPKAVLCLNVTTSDSATTMSANLPATLTITGYTEASSRTPPWFVVSCTWSLPEDGVETIGGFLQELAKEYTFQWSIDRTVDRLWLRYLYNTYKDSFPVMYV